MKTEFTEVSETRKHLSFEIEPDVVAAEIDRVAKAYSRSARVPGFRPGKVPTGVVKQRYKDQILQDVAQELIPRVVGEALRERELQPVASPDIKDLVLAEGQPLTFVADFETLPSIDPGEYAGIVLTKPPAVLEVGAVDHALEQLQERHARWEPVEDRPAASGDTLLVDLTRTRRARRIAIAGDAAPVDGDADGQPEPMTNVTVELGNSANPPGFDEPLLGTVAGDERAFTVTYPADYDPSDFAGATFDYAVTVKAIRRKHVLPLDDSFAKEVSDVATLEELRTKVREDLQHGAEHEAEHAMRHQLLQTLAGRLAAVPEVLVEQEVDRRLEDFVRRLMEQGVDPMAANVDWRDFRNRQRDTATATVRSTLVLDEIARREGIEATDEDLAAEIGKFAERAGHTEAAVRARLEKDGAIDRIRAGITREKTMSWLVGQAQVVTG